jgi:transposase
MDEQKQYSVAKRPLKHLPAEQRTQIAAEILQAYQQGEEVADLAPNYGVSDVTLYALLIREHEDAWKEAQRARALARSERVNTELARLRTEAQTAPDALSLARTREQIRIAEANQRSAQWELERVYRRIYGQDAGAHAGAAVNININLRRSNGEIVDVKPEDIETKPLS